MVFSSLPFIFFFMPLFFALYYIIPFNRAKNTIILIFSLIFYAWGEVKCLPLLLFVAFTDYIHVRLSSRLAPDDKRKKLLLILAISIDLLLLGYFKYADFIVGIVNGLTGKGFAMPGVALPVGISFFTFQSMSYSLDYAKGDVEAEKSYFDYLTYVSMFPQLVAGPIVRYLDIRERLHNRKVSFTDFSEGVVRFSMGLFKKVLIANQLGKVWDAALSLSGGIGISTAFAWLGALSFTLQLYFDFSAYSDMAIGMGRMMGFDFMENFRHPLSAVSITDFWRKWHISLSTWFRDYVYIPLGGNRCSVAKHLRNMFVVWFLTGLWHGASWNFVIWGLWHGVFLALEKYIWGNALNKLPRVLKHIYTLFIVVTGFTIFAIDDSPSLITYLGRMFGLTSLTEAVSNADILWYFENYKWIIIAAVILAFPVHALLKERIGKGRAKSHKSTEPFLYSALKVVGTVALFVLSIAFLVSDSYNPFLYFRF